jgi:IclR family acetate operon transcriptional repressor
MSNAVGHILPPNASSLGKVIAAFQSSDRREKLLRSFGLYRFTPRTIADRVILDAEFEQVRGQGYATDEEESVPDGYCFAAPIFGKNGEVQAAIGLALPKSRLKAAEQREHFVAALKSAAETISASL